MPWTNPMEQRYRFVCECLQGQSTMTALCERYGVSRRVGYKWLRRFKEGGKAGLEDRRRTPLRSPTATPPEVKEALLEIRRQHPTWGPAKLCKRLLVLRPELRVPAPSTVGLILEREGLVDEAISLRRRRSKACTRARPKRSLAASEAPNEVWCLDFKGDFRLGNGAKCYPFTLTDRYSRYVIACVCEARPSYEAVRKTLFGAFKRYGTPRYVRSDNGSPFGSDGLLGFSYLSVQLLRHGMEPEHIDPGCPQQNGTHERMHRPLKAETARPPAGSMRAQQQVMDAWRHCYNQERPHQGIDMQTPASLYAPSPRKLRRATSPAYPGHFDVRRVKANGEIRWKGAEVFVGKAFRGQPVGLEELDDDVWSVSYGEKALGTLSAISLKRGNWQKLTPLESWTRPKKARKAARTEGPTSAHSESTE